ncbi:DUF6538 domain-containing protein [Methylobacterium gossipiicola]|uniref:DUF6538 domain-containing protein n=1 Tax=Methylobacterium gossipiicola TaxID=582675 RepID=UPI003CC7A17C
MSPWLLGAKLTVRRAECLQCRRGRWYVRLRVPAHLVAAVGQQHLVRALDTASDAGSRSHCDGSGSARRPFFP